MSVDVEHVIKTIPLDAEFQNELRRLEGEGYELFPGITPVAIYHLIRKKPSEEGQGALGKIKIDETKVHVLRDGQLIPLDQL